MDLKKLATHPLTIIGSIGLGVATGIYMPEFAKSLKFVGDIYVDLLKMVILPFLISAVIVSINRLASNPSASRYVVRIVVSLMAGMAIAGAVGLAYMGLAKPGTNMDQDTMQAFGRLVQSDVSGVETSIHLLSPVSVDKQDGMLIKLVSRMIPSNFFTALSLGDTLKTLFFSLLFGLALTKSPGKSAVGFIEGCEVVFRACQKLTLWLLYVLPIASFSLAADQIANTGFEALQGDGAVHRGFRRGHHHPAGGLRANHLAQVWAKPGYQRGVAGGSVLSGRSHTQQCIVHAIHADRDGRQTGL